jgi:hypothetical protein
MENRYQLESIISAIPQSNPCACCGLRRYDTYLTRCRIRQTSLFEPQRTEEEIIVCGNCLHSVFGQTVGYKTTRRKQAYNQRFLNMIEWCRSHPGATAQLPTMQRFYHACEEGERMHPNLVKHAGRIIHFINRYPYVEDYLAGPDLNHNLCLSVDQCEEKSLQQILNANLRSGR